MAAPTLLGAWATVATQPLEGHGRYDFRETISPWFRSLRYLQPDPSFIAGVGPVRTPGSDLPPLTRVVRTRVPYSGSSF
nr:respiratory nitrate reductase subunit gamma [Luteimicrobium album]